MADRRSAPSKVVLTINLVRAALDHLNAERGPQDLLPKIRKTVNIASRVQHLAVWQAIFASVPSSPINRGGRQR
jgi:hypothetical protein